MESYVQIGSRSLQQIHRAADRAWGASSSVPRGCVLTQGFSVSGKSRRSGEKRKQLRNRGPRRGGIGRKTCLASPNADPGDSQPRNPPKQCVRRIGQPRRQAWNHERKCARHLQYGSRPASPSLGRVALVAGGLGWKGTGDLSHDLKDTVATQSIASTFLQREIDHLNWVRQVDALVTEVTSASAEQARSILRMKQAIGRLDEATQRNCETAEGSSAAAEELDAQAHVMEAVRGRIARIGGRRPGEPRRRSIERARENSGGAAKRPRDGAFARVTSQRRLSRSRRRLLNSQRRGPSTLWPAPPARVFGIGGEHGARGALLPPNRARKKARLPPDRSLDSRASLAL